MVTDEEILRIARAGEGQTIEFKESLSVSCKEEGTKSLVAFANREGGRVLFGMANDGTLKGANVGDKTIENLANFVTMRTYPSLPAHIETVAVAGKKLVVAETVGDRPPIVGLYMYSKTGIPLDEPVDAANLTGLRRVGRTNQVTDIMWLRTSMTSDPKLRLSVSTDRWLQADDGLPENLSGRTWVEDRSANAHQIGFATDDGCYISAEILDDLPTPYMSSGSGTFGEARPAVVAGWRTFQDFRMERSGNRDERLFGLVATYRDDAGLVWEARRLVKTVVRVTDDDRRQVSFEQGAFERRIRKFPPKRVMKP